MVDEESQKTIMNGLEDAFREVKDETWLILSGAHSSERLKEVKHKTEVLISIVEAMEILKAKR